MIPNEITLTTDGELDHKNWTYDLNFIIPFDHWNHLYEGDNRMKIIIEQLTKSDLIKLRDEIEILFPK